MSDLKALPLSNSSERLRIGIVSDSNRLRQWEMSCLEKLSSLMGIDFSLWIVPSKRYSVSRKKLHFLNRKTISSGLFRLWGICIWNRCPSNRFVSNRISPSIQNVFRLVINENREWVLDEQWEDRVAALKLDFMINFSAARFHQSLIKCLRFGVWEFQYGESDSKIVACPFFEEVQKDKYTVVVSLNMLTWNGTYILKHGKLKVSRHSYKKTVSACHRELEYWPAEVFKALLPQVGIYGDEERKSNAKMSALPGAVQWLEFFGRQLINKFVMMFEMFFRHTQWSIGIIEAPPYLLLDNERDLDICWLPAKSKGFRADPFVTLRDGKIFVFYEELEFKENLGKISYLELGAGTSIAKTGSVITSRTHLSYPYLLHVENEVYCIPESSKAREVCLYEAISFPERWEKVATLVDGVSAVDPTIVRYKDRWWLFFTDGDRGGDFSLCIWHSTNLFGPWKPHAKNPVKCDISSARPAGTPFEHEEKLYRPSQDCSTSYGARITINRVLKLTTTEFEEEVATVVNPDSSSKFNNGIHTMSCYGNITVVDGRRRIFSSTVLLEKLRQLRKRNFSDV